VLLSGFVAAIPVLTRAMLFLLAPMQTGLWKGWYLVPSMNPGHVLSILLLQWALACWASVQCRPCPRGPCSRRQHVA
jgi:hypothetical protein